MKPHPDAESERSPANTVENLGVAVGVVLLLIGLYGGNAFHVRNGTTPTEWTTLGVWVGAGAVCVVIGVAVAAAMRKSDGPKR